MPTITEGLAEIRVIEKRLEAKTKFVVDHVAREEKVRDPLLKQGGQPKLVGEELQAITDLEERRIGIRRAIQQSNRETTLVVQGESRTVGDWLTWRKEVAPGRKSRIATLRQVILNIRKGAQTKGLTVSGPAGAATADPPDVVVNVDEKALADEAEKIEVILAELDGQLTLRNSTTLIDY